MENIINDIARNAKQGEKMRHSSSHVLMDRVMSSVHNTIRKYFENATFISSKMAAIDVAKSLDHFDLAQDMQDDLTELLENEK